MNPIDAYAEVYKCGNWSRASIRREAHRVKTKPIVAARIEELQAEQAERSLITADQLIQGLGRVAFADIRSLFNEDGSLKQVHELDEDTAKAVAGIDVVTKLDDQGNITQTSKIKLSPRAPAMESLAKHLGLYKQDNEQRKPEESLNNQLKLPPAIQEMLDHLTRHKNKNG